MPRVLGYGGLANTNGARDFSTREIAEAPLGSPRYGRYMHAHGTRVYRPWFALLVFLVNPN